MPYTAAHWGAYRFQDAQELWPLDDDPEPSRIGRGWLSAATDPDSRILAPAIRKGWLEGDRGAGRNGDSFVRVNWETATRCVAEQLTRTRAAHGNAAIFAGSYGWSGAGRFHHAQSQLRRFLNGIGGYVSARETYSHAAAEVLFPHILGMSQRAVQDEITSMDEVAEHCQLLLAIGGISRRTAQITSSGTSRHDVEAWLARLAARKVRLISVSPMRSDMPGADWLSIRPGTDTALLLALSYELVASGHAATEFLDRYTSGWTEFRAYLMGDADGQPKSSEWAAPICDIAAPVIRDLADALARQRSMISVAWGLQRADHGEQPIWAGLALAAVLGQIGRPGTGFSFGYGSTTPVGRPTRLIPWPSLPQGQNPLETFIPVARLGDMLRRPGERYRYNGEEHSYPDIRLIYWVGGNPFHHHQDLNALENVWTRPETVIVHEHSWTATARRADIVLPATTTLERADLMMNRRDPTLLYMSPVMPPLGEALDDYEIFRRIAAHLGQEQAFTAGRDPQTWLRSLWAEAMQIANTHGFALPEFESFVEQGRFDLPDAAENRRLLAGFIADPDAVPLGTESGRITLFNKRLAGFDLADMPGHPVWQAPAESLLDAPREALHLISGQPDTRLHGQNDRGCVSQASKRQGREPAILHPETAAARGLNSGDIARLYNDRGACLVGVELSAEIRRDCVALATGAWFDPQIIEGQPLDVHGNPNVLTLDKGCSELSQGCSAHTALVFVEKWQGDLPPLSVDRPPEISQTIPEGAI